MAYQNIYVDTTGEPHTVYVWDDTNGLVTFPVSEFRYAYVRDPKGKQLNMMGQRVSKTRRFMKGTEGVFESDLPMETRVLTDLYLHEDSPSQGNVTMFFDIEVSMENGIPDIHNPNNEITSITTYNPTTEKYAVLVLDKEMVYQDKISPSVDIIFCSSEQKLLYSFIEHYTSISPTIITGWNSDGFDVPYLYNRIRQVCGVATANKLSPIGKVRYSERQERYKIAGVSSLDYLALYRKFTYTQQPNYRLDTIGRIEVNMGKIPYEGSLDKLFKENLETFIEYNLQDVKIIVELDKKLKLIELVRGICHIGHVPYEDYNMSSRFLEGTIVTYLHRKGIIVTDKPQDNKQKMEERGDDEGFVGAFVKEPIPGLYEWVYSLDLQSLYPSIIMSLNISPETKIGKVLNYNVDQHFKKEIVAYVVEEFGSNSTVELDYDSFMEFIEDNNLSISSNGVLYTNDKKGIVPEVLETWFAQRVEYKDLMKKYVTEGNKELAAYYDQRQHIQKIFLNSLYGVLGLPVFRFYDVDNAAAVTITGQDVIKNSAKLVNIQYNKKLGTDNGDYITYIDTDSIYASAKPLLTSGDDPKQFTIELARTTEKLLNKFYDSLAKKAFNCNSHKLYIKGESIASTGFWVAKKRYALDKVYDLETNKDVNKMVIKGLDVVRSSFPKAFREFMSQMLTDILKGTSKDIIDTNVLEFKSSLPDRAFLDVARNTSANNISQFTVGSGTTASSKKGTPVHIKAAIAYNKLLHHFNIETKYEKIHDGEKIKYVYLKTNPLRIETLAIKGYQDPPQITQFINTHIDTDALFNNELKNKLEDFYTALGWGNIPTEVNQNADQFFVW